jgi:hypothetical protein
MGEKLKLSFLHFSRITFNFALFTFNFITFYPDGGDSPWWEKRR